MHDTVLLHGNTYISMLLAFNELTVYWVIKSYSSIAISVHTMYKLYMGFIKFKDYYLNQTGRVKNVLVGVTARLSALKWQLESLSIKKTG